MPEPRPGRPAEPTMPLAILVLLIAGGFHVYRGAPAEGVVFWVVAALLIADRVGWLPEVRSSHRRGVAFGADMLIAVAAGLVLMLLPRAGPAITVVVAAIGATGLVLLWPAPGAAVVVGQGRRRALSATAWAWAGVATAACVYELVIYFLGDGTGNDLEFPALSDLLGPGVEHVWGRGIFIALWVLAGLTLLRWTFRGDPVTGAGEPRADGPRRVEGEVP